MPDLSLLTASLRISVPYTAGAVGGAVTERSGTVNIAIEGFMLVGAFSYACVAYYCQASWFPNLSEAHPCIPILLGLLAGIIGAVLLSVFHAITTLLFKADHIVSGLAVNFLALGGTDFFLQKFFGSASNSPHVPTFVGGDIFGEHGAWSLLNPLFHPLIILLVLHLVAIHLILNHTQLGLRMRAAGENPLASGAAGISALPYRLAGIFAGAGCAALGGIWLVSEQGMFSSNMTAGRGYIALAAMILGRWKIWAIAAVCLFFGFAEALQNWLQVARIPLGGDGPADLLALVPVQFVQALPYILTVIVVAGFAGKSKPPAALGRPLAEE